MAFGDVTITLRPIKFAFLVNPAERDILDRVIQANLFQWGGLHNPIVPIYRRLPTYWSDLPTRRMRPAEICASYLRVFDPDAVIVCGNVDKSVVPSHVHHVHTLGEFEGDLSKEDAPTFGVGLFEVLSDFAAREFKYTRRDGLKIIMPEFGGKHVTLFKAVFGNIPVEARRETYRELMEQIDGERPTVTDENFLQVIRGRNPFLSSLCAHRLEFRRSRSDRSSAVFLLDHTNALDIIDFWNLRAMGWHVLPIPLKLAGQSDTLDFVQRFVAGYRSADKAPQGIADVSIVKGRSVAESAFDGFVNAVPRIDGQPLTVQVWYPPMWDEFSYRRNGVICSSISAGEAETQVSDEKARVRIKALPPDFMARGLGHGPRYANDIRIAMYGRSEFGAEVLPPYEKSVARLFGIGMFTDWRTGPSGPTYLGRYANATIHLNQPSARDVVATVLAARGWKEFALSPSGNVAYQMMKHLGGPNHIGLLQNVTLIQFLETLAAGRDTAEEDKLRKRIDAKLKAAKGAGGQIPLGEARRIIGEEMRRVSGTTLATGDVEEREFFKNMSRIANSQRFPLNVGTLVENYTKAKLFNLGIRVQCSVCEQRAWHPLEVMRSEIECPICLSRFPLPIHDPRNALKWSYKSLGPFALPKQGFGAYSVLLTVLFLSTHQHPATTSVLSFRALQNNKELEADFMMFYRDSAFWERETETIYGECKSFNGFTEKDVRRMRRISEDNPDAVLVFATLAQEFSDRDKQLLTSFVRTCRKYGKMDRPKNPVLLLTGTELFSSLGPPQCWRDAGGRMKAFADAGRRTDNLIALCDATQQLHLGLRPWWEDWKADFEKRRRTKGKV
jgi:hypothetical protein